MSEMGSVCCCLSVEDFEDYVNPNSSVYRNCVCLGCFLENLLSVFRRGEGHSVASSVAGSTESLADMYRSPPRPLPYDADPRYVRLQRDGLVSRRDKASSHDSEPLTDKWNDDQDASDHLWSKSSSLRLSSAAAATTLGNVYTSPEEEDVCPTCLEEYSPENPKITTKCAHHFHLGCIYEWMERSDSCPVCGKVMVFDESP